MNNSLAMKKLHRRKFLKDTLAAATGLAVAPTIIPASALGRGGAVAPSERIVLGGIGIHHTAFASGPLLEERQVQGDVNVLRSDGQVNSMLDERAENIMSAPKWRRADDDEGTQQQGRQKSLRPSMRGLEAVAHAKLSLRGSTLWADAEQ